ncbi:MAG: thiamine-phosphate kinase [Spongiibacteraceae bacterium]|nr:thiamine-phosphate kinase [Spongiibacteraceae bacterium]
MKSSSSLSEFEVIQHFFSNIGSSAEIDLGVGDDCALLSIPNGQRLALSIDSLLVGRHFPADAAPFDIAQRALAVSISDLAAMGARPLAFTLALSLPDVDQNWLQSFSEGLRASAGHYQIPLIGGDTTKGPLSITIQVHGLLPGKAGLQRDGAQPGDRIFVSGCLGDAAAALDVLQQKIILDTNKKKYFYSRFYQPQARITLGVALLNVANAAIDISDGLLADLTHIARASSVAATVYSEKIPFSDVLVQSVNNDQALRYALTGGDDYELCFTANARHRQQLAKYADMFGVPITEIGEITSGEGVQCLDQQGCALEFAVTGYQHF